MTGAIVGMSTYGASAPLKDLQGLSGFTPDAARSRLALVAAA